MHVWPLALHVAIVLYFSRFEMSCPRFIGSTGHHIVCGKCTLPWARPNAMLMKGCTCDLWPCIWQLCFTFATLTCHVKNPLQAWLMVLCVESVLYLSHVLVGCSLMVACVVSPFACGNCALPSGLRSPVIDVLPLPLHVASQCALHWPLSDGILRIHCKHGPSHGVWQLCFTLALSQGNFQTWLP